MSLARRADDTVKLTIRLPREDVAFAEAYAQAHGLTVTEFIDRWLRRLRHEATDLPDTLSPEVEAVAGLIPSDVDLEAVRREWLETKHR